MTLLPPHLPTTAPCPLPSPKFFPRHSGRHSPIAPVALTAALTGGPRRYPGAMPGGTHDTLPLPFGTHGTPHGTHSSTHRRASEVTRRHAWREPWRSCSGQIRPLPRSHIRRIARSRSARLEASIGRGGRSERLADRGCGLVQLKRCGPLRGDGHGAREGAARGGAL